MASFSFADFMVFTGAKNVSEDMYSTIARGVISYVKRHYNIYPEAETIVQNVYLETNQTSFTPKAFPINNVYRIWYDNDMLDDSTYSYYGEDILLDTAVEDIRKPLTLELEVGYTSPNCPDDLVLAIYRHIVAVYHAIDKHTDNLSKSINSEGNTSYYNNEVVPPACRETYQFYAGHTLLKV